MGVGRPMLLTISTSHAAKRRWFCFMEWSWAGALLALSSACTELADPAERGLVGLSPEPEGVALAVDGGVIQRPEDEPGDDGSGAALDASRAEDSSRPSRIPDAGHPNFGDAAASSGADADSSTPDPFAPCPSGLRFENSCYRASLVALSWSDARDDCLAGGGDLVSIDSVGEDAFVAALLGTSLWLGATDRALEGTFQWTDGRAVTFANWGTNQPDSFPGQNCVEKRAEPGAPWYDQSCDNLDFYVCERPLP